MGVLLLQPYAITDIRRLSPAFREVTTHSNSGTDFYLHLGGRCSIITCIFDIYIFDVGMHFSVAI